MQLPASAVRNQAWHLDRPGCHLCFTSAACQYTEAVTLQALGCLLFFIAFGKLPFEGDAKLQVLNGDYRMPRARPEGVRALIRDMLTVSPAARPTIDQVSARRPCSRSMCSTGWGLRLTFFCSAGHVLRSGLAWPSEDPGVSALQSGRRRH